MLALLIQIAGFAASVCAGLMFVWAGVAKLRHRALLPGVIANYRLLPDGLIAPAALLLPPAEVVIGVALILGSRPLAPVAGIALLLAFAAAMAVNIVRGRRHIDCGCGHAGLRQSLGWPLVVRNGVIAATLGLRLGGGSPLAASEIAVAAASGAALFVLTMVFAALAALTVPVAAARG